MVGRIRAWGDCFRVAGPSKIPLKGVEQERLEGNKVFKKWGQSGSRNRCLEKGVGTPLQTVTKYPINSEGTIGRYSTKNGVLKNFTGIFLWILCNFSNSGNKIWSVKRTWEIFFFKNHAEDEFVGLVSDLFLPYEKALQKIKANGWSCRSKGLKLIKKKLIFHTFFPKILFTEEFLMTVSADSSVPTKFLSHFYDHTFLYFPSCLSFYYWHSW